jgi:hypothetical protein
MRIMRSGAYDSPTGVAEFESVASYRRAVMLLSLPVKEFSTDFIVSSKVIYSIR